MESLMQIEAVRLIEARINSIQRRISSWGEEKEELKFKSILWEKINNSNQGVTPSACTLTRNALESAYQMGANIMEKLGESEIINNINAQCETLCAEIGLDPALAKSIINVESNFNPQATSSAGAMGLMQLMPSTAASLGVTEPYDIYQNLKGGITLIKNLLESFNGNVKLALAAYNAGSARVREYGDVPPIEETRNYVYKVLSVYNPNLL